MTDPVSEKAMSLVGPINKAYNDLKTSYRTSLTHALELGRLLVIAHEAVGKNGWKDYLAKNCPQVTYRTATVYMQLDEHREKFEDPAARCTSRHSGWPQHSWGTRSGGQSEAGEEAQGREEAQGQECRHRPCRGAERRCR
jgi:hypothetical protein